MRKETEMTGGVEREQREKEMYARLSDTSEGTKKEIRRAKSVRALQPHLQSGYYRQQIQRNCPMRVLAGRHVLVIGRTGCGKTYWMAQLCVHLPAYIFVNPQEETIVDSITQIVTEDPNDVVKLLEEGYRKIQFLPMEDDLGAIDQLEVIRRDLWSVAGEMNIKDGQWWMNFICDEAQIFAPLGSRTDLQTFARRGRRYGIKSWFLSQQPQDLSKGIVNNCDWQVLFKLGQYSSVYFKTYRIPIEPHLDHIAKEYHYCIYNGEVMYECQPI